MTTSAYVAGRGPLYIFDARAKLLLLLLLCFIVFLPLTPLSLWLVVLFSFALAWFSTSFKRAIQIVKTILFLLIIMVLFVPITYRNGSVVLKVGSFVLATKEALESLNILVARFMAITYLCTLYIWTTSMADIQLSLRWYGLPYEASLVMTLAFRFIPFVADSFKMIQDSHALRNAEEKEKRTISDTVATVTAALVVALKAIPFLAMSLESRGLGRDNKRTEYRTLKSKGPLLVHFLIAIVVPIFFYLVFKKK